MLVGTFYDPLNSTTLILADIANSIGLAIDTSVQDVVILNLSQKSTTYVGNSI